MRRGQQDFAVLAMVAALAVAGRVPADGAEAAEASNRFPDAPPDASARLVERIEEGDTRSLVEDVLHRNPRVAAAEARARAARQRTPQARALPDPVASLTAFVAPPETRTGPQRLAAGLSQGLPWPGKRGLRERAARLAAAALEAEADAVRLELVTGCRRLVYELAFLDRFGEVAEEFRTHLLQHEEIARARYATGVGQGQGVIKLQAAITRAEQELLDIEARRLQLAAELNALRDRPAAAPLPAVTLPAVAEVSIESDELLDAARRRRPELAAAELGIERAAVLAELAEKGYRPDFHLGLTYTVVGRRDDAPGRLQPPPDNGDDVVGIQAGVTLPVWRKKLAAGVAEAAELRRLAEAQHREIAASIEAAVGELAQRVPLGWRQLHLVEKLLTVQAREALESALSGYVAGTLNALDLLDAEHVLFDAQIAAARARADYLVGLARLEGAIGGPLTFTDSTERTES